MKTNRRWLYTIWFVIVPFFIFGFWGGYKSRERLQEKGCLRLSTDIVNPIVSTGSNLSTKFIALGDTGTGDTSQKKVAAAASRVCEKEGCDFGLLLGDNFYPAGVSSVQDSRFETRFEKMYASMNIPFFAVLGNHDTKGDALSQVIYSLKSDRWRMPNFRYDFRAGPARFFGLNSGCFYFPWTWLIDRIRKDSSAWTFVFAHRTIYGSGTHGDADWFPRWFWKIFVKEKADFYISGHDHELEHLRLPGDSTEYIVSGAGGKNYASLSEKKKTKISRADSRFVFQNSGFVWFDVTGPQVQARFFDSEAKELYRFTKKRTP